MARRIGTSNARTLLGVAVDADKQTIKRVYFRLSKDFHPDRYYARRLGSYGARLAAVFEAIAGAYEELTTSGGRRRVASPSQEPQTPQEYAADLFARACAAEVQGDPTSALKLFDAAIRVDGQARYLRRAASCALSVRDTRLGLEYAKKAANLDSGDASTARLLAQAFRAVGKLADAEEVLVMAMALKNENDVLGAELRTDLSEVRRLMASRGGYP
jgi:curved DNA-binding protein CbpA